MRIYKVCILLILLLFASGTAYSQENRTEIRVDFRVNSASIDRAYGKNTERLSEISAFLQRIEQDSTLTIVEVSFCGSASPEGSYQLNHKLARARLETLEDIVRREVELPDSIVTRDDSYISWEYLKEKVVESDMPQKQAILDIIAQEPQLVDYPGGRHIDHRIVKLQKLDGGKVWRQLHTLYFERMRNACVVFITYKREIIQPIEPVVPPMKVDILQKPEVDSIIIPESKEQNVTAEDWTRGLYLKTNALFWGMGMTNVSVEIDLAKHLSFTLPVCYSAWNYFTSTIKFRTLAVQPEFRYWFKEDNQRFFVGAHFGYAQYNVAVDGDYRIQDHNGTSPALGGGISVGYRMPISKNNRWHIEFTLGAGVYGLHYDKFYNVNNGKLVDTYRKTYWGIDNAAVNISYRFDLKKRKK